MEQSSLEVLISKLKEEAQRATFDLPRKETLTQAIEMLMSLGKWNSMSDVPTDEKLIFLVEGKKEGIDNFQFVHIHGWKKIKNPSQMELI